MDKTKIERLRHLMIEDASIKALIKKQTKEFEESIRGLRDQQQIVVEQMKGLKDTLTDEAIAEFKATGEKKLLGGIGIRESSCIDYELSKAEEFAREKGLFMCFDKKAFEKAAPSLGLDFVKNTKKVSVTFPRDPEKVLLD